MMQDSLAAHKSYTVAFNTQKGIAKSRLMNYILASTRATLGTRLSGSRLL